MSVNISEIVCQNLGYPALQKIDPNTEAEGSNKPSHAVRSFEQATIPSILTGFYKYVLSDEGATVFLRENNSPDWVNKIFGDQLPNLLEKITGYTRERDKDALKKMNVIAAETHQAVKDNLPENADIKDVKVFFSDQINQILLYLPAELQVGELLQEGTLDDKTNKMEGPFSSLMQNLGAIFSGSETDKELDNNKKF